VYLETNLESRYVNSLLSKHQLELECLSANDRNHRLVQVNVVKQMQLVKEFLQVMYPEEHDHISIHGFLYDRMRNRADRVLLHHWRILFSCLLTEVSIFTQKLLETLHYRHALDILACADTIKWNAITLIMQHQVPLKPQCACYCYCQ
jgi:hypothetical protein